MPTPNWFDHVDARPAPWPGLNWLTTMIYVTDVPLAVNTYTDLLGFVSIFELPNDDGGLDFARMRYRGNNITIAREGTFDHDGRAPSTTGATPPSMFYLYVDDADAICSAAPDLGCTVIEPPTEQFWGDIRARIADPFGHIWDVATRIAGL